MNIKIQRKIKKQLPNIKKSENLQRLSALRTELLALQTHFEELLFIKPIYLFNAVFYYKSFL